MTLSERRDPQWANDTREVWACPHGHRDWARRTSSLVGRDIEFWCQVCDTRWKATAEQRTAVLRYMAKLSR
jgi:hypothetical protein